jgi:hypothetical protein
VGEWCEEMKPFAPFSIWRRMCFFNTQAPETTAIRRENANI